MITSRGHLITPLFWGPCLCIKYFETVNVGWSVGCFGFNDPLRQYFSLYRTVSQREGERKEK